MSEIEDLKRENEELKYVVKTAGKAFITIAEMIGARGNANINVGVLTLKLPALALKIQRDPSLLSFLCDEKFQTLINKYADTNSNQ